MQYRCLWLAGICYGLVCIFVGVDSGERIWASEEGIEATQTASSAQNQQHDIKQPICVLGQAFLSSENSLNGYTGTYHKSELVSRDSSYMIRSDLNDDKIDLDSSSSFSTPSTIISYSDTSTNWTNTNMHLVTMASYSLASNVSENKSESTKKTVEFTNLSPVACELHIPPLAENAETSLVGDFPGAKIEDHVIATFNTPNSLYMITSSFVLNDGKVVINIKNIGGQDLESEVFSVAIIVFSS